MASNECPVSLITEESRWLVQQLSEHRKVIAAGGTSFFRGEDPPCWWHDALVTEETYRILEHNAGVRASMPKT